MMSSLKSKMTDSCLAVGVELVETGRGQGFLASCLATVSALTLTHKSGEDN